MTTWTSKLKWYRAKRRTSPGPGFVSGEVLLLDRDKRHSCDENPDGSILVYEGLVFRAYPTPKVKALLASGMAEEVDDPESAPDANYIDDDLVGSILSDGRIVTTLETHGISTVEELVESVQSGQINKLKGIGPSSLETINWALAENGLIQYAGDDEI